MRSLVQSLAPQRSLSSRRLAGLVLVGTGFVLLATQAWAVLAAQFGPAAWRALEGGALGALATALGALPVLAIKEAELLLAQGRPDASIAAANAAIALKRDSPKAYVALGAALEARGEEELALVEYRRALALDARLDGMRDVAEPVSELRLLDGVE